MKSPSQYFVRFVNWLAAQQLWSIPLIIYATQLILKWFIYKDPEKFWESLEKLGEDMSFIGFSILIIAIIRTGSAFRHEFASNLLTCTIISIIIFILLCCLAIYLCNKQGKVESKTWKYILIIKEYFVGYICLSISIGLL